MKKIVLLAFVLVLFPTAVIVRFTTPVIADGTIYIRPNGSVYPPDAPISSVDNVTYTLTADIYMESIQVSRNNIVVDGAGYTVQGTGSGTGISLTGVNNVTIKNMKIKEFYYGIRLFASNNSISGNNVKNNVYGIWADFSSNNTISGNNITKNVYGIRLWNSSNNIIYHNNFVDNTEQVKSYYSTNVWDDGYPSGGNYWSDHTDIDQYSGPYQNETGSDDIWDHPYIIDEKTKTTIR